MFILAVWGLAYGLVKAVELTRSLRCAWVFPTVVLPRNEMVEIGTC